ncbi:MAG TPA: hypothetical protein VF002_09275 [Gaiellaceae bacterium]
MKARTAAYSGFLVGALVLGVAWIFELPLARIAALAPLIVLVAAAVAGLGVFWFRAAADSVRGSRRPRVILALGAGIILLGILLTVLGVALPRE